MITNVLETFTLLVTIGLSPTFTPTPIVETTATISHDYSYDTRKDEIISVDENENIPNSYNFSVDNNTEMNYTEYTVEEDVETTNDNENTETPIVYEDNNTIEVVEDIDNNVIEVPMTDAIYHDYVENELIALITTEEEANIIADEYGFTLTSYYNGVTIYNTNGKDPLTFIGDGSMFELNYLISICPPTPSSDYEYTIGNYEGEEEIDNNDEIIVDNND